MKTVRTLCIVMLLLFCLPLLVSSAYAQDLTGTWCVETDSNDCIILLHAGESLHFQSLVNGQLWSEGVGWVRNGKFVTVSRLANKPELAMWIGTVDPQMKLTGRSLNPDGSVRWTGSYVKKNR